MSIFEDTKEAQDAIVRVHAAEGFTPRVKASQLTLILATLNDCLLDLQLSNPELFRPVSTPEYPTYDFPEKFFPDGDPAAFVEDPSRPGYLRRCYNPYGLVAFYTEKP